MTKKPLSERKMDNQKSKRVMTDIAIMRQGQERIKALETTIALRDINIKHFVDEMRLLSEQLSELRLENQSLKEQLDKSVPVKGG